MSPTTIGLVVASILATYLITRHFTKKSIEKKLSVYVDYATSLFGDVDPEVRENLRITYQGHEVERLSHIRFVVVNDGERSIKSYVEPLTLILPEESRVLTVSILETNPPDLDVEADLTLGEDGEERISFDFSLLNRNDWFVVNLLVRGEVDREDLEFRIRAEDVPTKIPVLSHRQYTPPGIRHYVAGGTAALVPLMAGAACWYFEWPSRELMSTIFSKAEPDKFPSVRFVLGAMVAVFATLPAIRIALNKLWPQEERLPPFTEEPGPRKDKE